MVSPEGASEYALHIHIFLTSKLQIVRILSIGLYTTTTGAIIWHILHFKLL